MSRPFTVCVLLYGPHTDLAKRCLDSIETSLQAGGSEAVEDIRIGLNEVVPETAIYINGWASRVSALGVPVRVLVVPKNAGKYPVMRRLFYEPARLAEFTMWFDDDSYLTGERGWWWQALHQCSHEVSMVGQLWHRPLIGNQHLWLAQQPWATKTAKRRQQIAFCQGAWWIIRSSLLYQYDWPVPEIHHCGGDQMLGALCDHQGLRIKTFSEGVRINADEQGLHSKAPRRGIGSGPREPLVGEHYNPERPLDLLHHRFKASWLEWFPRGSGDRGLQIIELGL